MIKKIDSKKIVRNTGMLYVRQILILGINLVSVRVLFQGLGEEDYGLYTLIAGIVTMFSILSGAMASSCQRFYSYYLGQEKYEDLKKTIWASIIVYILIACVVVLVTETVGLWYVGCKLSVPAYRHGQAIFLYHCSVLSLVFTIFVAPLIAYVLSNEDMDVYAIVSILEITLKLLSAFVITAFPHDRRLPIYGIFISITSCVVFLIYFCVVKKKYGYHLGGAFDKSLFREMLSFAAWSLLGASIFSFKNQAINIVLNQSFNPIIVASRGIAASVYSALVSFAQNFSNALTPQVVKNYASGNVESLYAFVFFSSKITFLLTAIIIFPIWFDMPIVLRLWLGSVPEYAIEFARLGLLEALVSSITFPVSALSDATGNIKIYQVIVGGILLLNFPLSFLLLCFSKNPLFVYFIAIGLAMCAGFAATVCVGITASFPARNYHRDVLGKCYCIGATLFGGALATLSCVNDEMARHIVGYGLYAVVIFLGGCFFLFSPKERNFVAEMLHKVYEKTKVMWRMI